MAAEPPLLKRRRARNAWVVLPFCLAPLYVVVGGPIPGWSLIAIVPLGLLTLIGFAVAGSRYRSRIKKCNYMLCTECGYDLRGSPEQGRCPECGHDYDIEQVELSWRAHIWRA